MWDLTGSALWGCGAVGVARGKFVHVQWPLVELICGWIRMCLYYVLCIVCGGLKKFSDWPSYPQLYVNGELLGGLDIIKVCCVVQVLVVWYSLLVCSMPNVCCLFQMCRTCLYMCAAMPSV